MSDPVLRATHSRQIPALVMTFGLASLMVSTIRFPSFKELNWRSRATFGYMMIRVLTMILVAVKPEVTLFFALAAYVVLSLLWNLAQVVQRVARGEKAPRPI